jgi:hypothetical protein
MLPYKFWLISMEKKQKKNIFWKKDWKKKSSIGLKCTIFPFSILEQFLKFKACKSEKHDVPIFLQHNTGFIVLIFWTYCTSVTFFSYTNISAIFKIEQQKCLSLLITT